MTCPEEIVEYMHDYLDEEISSDSERILKGHLQSCEDCRNYLYELKKAVSYVKVPASITVSSDFTERVMASLPQEAKKKGKLKGWMMGHPVVSAAALFLVLISGAMLTSWNQGEDFSVTRQSNLIVENHTVIVPEGKTVKGDILVRNGDIKIEGRVQGDVTVINGDRYLASAGSVTGDIKEIDQAFEWLWYKIKTSAKEVSSYITTNSFQ
ncbi:anti-sigma factor RsiW [Peribacillus deserti]|uniref:Anti-sigma factor RsiW n=1 Tax=Peribacillus deserti TaxID=673318 RepID=A0ABS2QLW0_9BACI|nr:zf-HC2 domain-containing protein [Peribacillus deserti]MBM7694164.1 anti-sigma factor RsiW [Peribacillus deserti]